MKINNLELETVCGISSPLPRTENAEVAFWGRSNVGKSSLLNALWGRRSMARTSSEPGKTQTINYYKIEFTPDDTPMRLYMVDLPGYGYAKISKSVSAKWMTMINRYLSDSESLRGIFLLIDSRHDPTSKDIEQFELLYRMGFNPIIVATKLDKLKKNEKARSLKNIENKITEVAHRVTEDMGDTLADDFYIPVIGFSSVTGEGVDVIWEYLTGFLEYISD